MDYSILLMKDNELIGDSSKQALTQSDFLNSTSMIIKQNNQEWNYSTHLNSSGGLTCSGDGLNLSRVETMAIFGGQDNYNEILHSQGFNLPSLISSNVDQNVLIGGVEYPPEFYMYEDGEIYLRGLGYPLSEEQLKAYWPNLYSSLTVQDVGGLGSTVEKTLEQELQKKEKKQTNPSQTGGGGGSSSKKSTNKDKSTGTGTNTNTNTNDSKTGEKRKETSKETNTSNTSSSGTSSSNEIIKVNYSELESMVSTLDSSLANLKATAANYQSTISEIAASPNWVGDDKDKLVSCSNADYATYINDVINETIKLKEQINTCIAAFQSAEDRICSLTI